MKQTAQEKGKERFSSLFLGDQDMSDGYVSSLFRAQDKRYLVCFNRYPIVGHFNCSPSVQLLNIYDLLPLVSLSLTFGSHTPVL